MSLPLTYIILIYFTYCSFPQPCATTAQLASIKNTWNRQQNFSSYIILFYSRKRWTSSFPDMATPYVVCTLLHYFLIVDSYRTCYVSDITDKNTASHEPVLIVQKLFIAYLGENSFRSARCNKTRWPLLLFNVGYLGIAYSSYSSFRAIAPPLFFLWFHKLTPISFKLLQMIPFYFFRNIFYWSFFIPFWTHQQLS